MMPADHDDEIFRMLSQLTPPEPNAVRARRVVERCRAALTRRDRWQQQRQSAGRQFVEAAVVGAFALVYLAAMIHDVWRWPGTH